MRNANTLACLGVVVGLMAFTACGGGDAAEQAGEGAMSEGSEAAQTAMSEGAEGDEAMASGESAAGEEGMEMSQQAGELPEGVTQEMVSQGDEIFHGAGLCYACHGQDAKGLPGLGANLTDSEWLHIDGSYESIIANVKSGVPAGKSTTGTPMPPKGGSSITDEQVRAVAAYVWSLSHGG